jgi:predicted ATP-grasp superfamily ATP-dependent carboligase
MTDQATLTLSAKREAIFEVRGKMVMPSHRSLTQALDKSLTTQLAESCGLAVPRTVELADLEHTQSVSRVIRFPVVLKPRSSQRSTRSGGMQATGRPLYVRNPEELASAYLLLSGRCSQIIAQEFVEGYGAGYFVLLWGGELQAEFAHRRIRDVHPTGSGSSLRVSMEVPARIREASLALLRRLGWHGVAMVEFRVRPDGTPVFMELNGRFWNSLALAVYAGADFPRYLAELVERGRLQSAPGFRAQVRCRWLLGDFRHFLAVLRGAPPGFPLPYPGRLDTLLKVLLPVPGTFHDNFELLDPLPEVGDWLSVVQWIPELIRRRKASRQP